MNQEAVLFVRSATDDESGAESRKAQEQAGREYAQKNGYQIAQVWEEKGKVPLESRRALRGFVEYVKASPSIQALLLERPDRLSRRFRDWVELHDFCRKNGKELRFFGPNQSPLNDAMVLEVSMAFYRHAIESRREARKAKKPPDSA
jgi:DNA invertase Pin-like site-specific DNA recombinase